MAAPFALSFWIDAFIKIEEMQTPYKVLCGLLLSASLVLFSNRIPNSWYKQALFGAALGQLASFLALLTSNLFIPNGIERTLKTINRSGLLEVLTLDFVVAVLLCGWLVGAIIFLFFGKLRANSTEL
jgi:glucan phosphoethanolaminetransferase (alkaline phosphatase superfamily)